MSTVTIPKPIRLSTGVFTDAELDYFDSLGEDYFPSEETHPVGETDWHYLSISTAFQLLHHVFPDPSNVYIAANHFIYWDRKQKGQVVSPDLYVVKGAGRRPRSSYKVWEEGGRTPDVVFEVASEETGKHDLGAKKDIYEQVLKVPEYFLFDPIGRIYPERLQGFRLEQGVYQPIALVDGRLTSAQLGLELLMEGMLLRFHDPVRRALIPMAAELEAARQHAEAENARLRAEIESLRARSQGEK
jgi:Uma2 family endonuclease